MGYENSSKYVFDPSRGNNYGGEGYDRAAMELAFTQQAGGCPSCGGSALIPTVGPEAAPQEAVDAIAADHMSTLEAELGGLTLMYGENQE